MQVAIPKDATSVKLSYDAGGEPSEQAYLAFCRANPDLRVERNAKGEILIVPPAGSESSNRSLKVAAQLGTWAERDGRGEAFDSSAQFMLPDGSALSPDAAWVSNETLRRFSKRERRGFLHLCPEFATAHRST